MESPDLSEIGREVAAQVPGAETRGTVDGDICRIVVRTHAGNFAFEWNMATGAVSTADGLLDWVDEGEGVTPLIIDYFDSMGLADEGWTALWARKDVMDNEAIERIMSKGYEGLFEKRKRALDKLLVQVEGLSGEDWGEITRGEREGILDTESGRSYLVLTDAEAESLFYAECERLFDELGMNAYSKEFREWIYRNAVKEDWFQNEMEENNLDYAKDIASSSSDEGFENRLVEEAYERGLIAEGDFAKLPDGEPDYGKCLADKDELIDRFAESMDNEYDDPVDYFEDHFGLDMLSDVLKEHPELIDLDEVAAEIKFSDGRGPTLSRWDGYELEITSDGEDWFIYRMD